MANTDKTRFELVFEAAVRLQVVGVGQVLENEYNDRIGMNLDPMIEQLAADGICNLVDTQHIPAEWFDSLVGLLANMSASVAGANFDPQIKEYYESRLRRLTASRPSFAILESEYF